MNIVVKDYRVAVANTWAWDSTLAKSIPDRCGADTGLWLTQFWQIWGWYWLLASPSLVDVGLMLTFGQLGSGQMRGWHWPLANQLLTDVGLILKGSVLILTSGTCSLGCPRTRRTLAYTPPSLLPPGTAGPQQTVVHIVSIIFARRINTPGID